MRTSTVTTRLHRTARFVLRRRPPCRPPAAAPMSATAFAPLPPGAVAPDEYDARLAAKVDTVRRTLGGLLAPGVDFTVARSAAAGYRLRAEFRVWHEGDGLDYVMFDTRDPAIKPPPRLIVNTFPVGPPLMAALMDGVRSAALASPALRARLFQANFHTALSGDAVVTLLYHRRLDAEWGAAAAELKAALTAAAAAAGGRRVDVVGRARGQRVDVDRQYVEETLTVGGRGLHYRQVEGAFSQPNGRVCEAMLTWAADVARGGDGRAAERPAEPVAAQAPPRPDDLLELYCGNGNFTVALAPAFRRVVATEVSRASVAVATHNLAVNGCAASVALARADADRVAAALTAVDGGGKTTLGGGAIDLADYDLATVFVDPPRAGVGPVTAALLPRFDRVLYVSCNPATLAADAAVGGGLAATHVATRAAVFDQFPGTDHIECGLLFERR